MRLEVNFWPWSEQPFVWNTFHPTSNLSAGTFNIYFRNSKERKALHVNLWSYLAIQQLQQGSFWRGYAWYPFFSTELPRLVACRDLGSVYRRLLRLGKIKSRIFLLYRTFLFQNSWKLDTFYLLSFWVPWTVLKFPFLQFPVPRPELEIFIQIQSILFWNVTPVGYTKDASLFLGCFAGSVSYICVDS